MLRFATLIMFFAIARLGSASATAQLVDLSWCTIDGGGGRSTGGGFVVTGTIGQPDASTAPLTGGSYNLVGGFWPGALPVDECVGDIVVNGSVDVGDLLAVVSGWGMCPGCPPAQCSADVAPIGAGGAGGSPSSGDCQIGVADLLLIVGAWGQCP